MVRPKHSVTALAQRISRRSGFQIAELHERVINDLGRGTWLAFIAWIATQRVREGKRCSMLGRLRGANGLKALEEGDGLRNLRVDTWAFVFEIEVLDASFLCCGNDRRNVELAGA